MSVSNENPTFLVELVSEFFVILRLLTSCDH